MAKICLCSMIIFFVLLNVRQHCVGLATGAVYLIQNQGSKQCLSSGPVFQSERTLTKTLFKKGQILTKPCSNISTFESTDYGQEWIVRIHKEEPQTLSFQVELAMQNVKYNDTDLHTTLKGEVISYFPHLISLKGRGLPGNEETQSHEFIIMDSATQQCLTDEIMPTQKTYYTNCTNGAHAKGVWNSFLKWNFTLINDIEIIRRELNSLNALNGSSLSSTTFHAL